MIGSEFCFSNGSISNHLEFERMFPEVYGCSSESKAASAGLQYSEAEAEMFWNFGDFESSWIDEVYPTYAGIGTVLLEEPQEYSAEIAPSSYDSSMSSEHPRLWATNKVKSDRHSLSPVEEVNYACETGDLSASSTRIKKDLSVPLAARRYRRIAPRRSILMFCYRSFCVGI